MKEKYIEWKKGYLRNPQSWKQYKFWVERIHAFAGDSVEDISLEQISHFIQVLKEKYASKNIEFGMSIIHNYFDFCSANGAKCVSPKLVIVPKSRGKLRKPTTDEICKQILDKLPTNEWIPLRDGIIMRILRDSGCRVSEVLAIDFRNLDHGSASIPTRKTNEFRNIYWSEETDKLLFEKYIPIRICLDYHEDALFVSRFGEEARGRLQTKTVQRSIKKLCNELGIEGITAHSFRHGKAHSMLEKGAPLSDIASILGHKNLNSTMKYLSLSNSEMEKRAKKYL